MILIVFLGLIHQFDAHAVITREPNRKVQRDYDRELRNGAVGLEEPSITLNIAATALVAMIGSPSTSAHFSIWLPLSYGSKLKYKSDLVSLMQKR
jgi:hypothetical protein